MGDAGKGWLRSGRGTPTISQPPWKTHRVDIPWGEKWWLLLEAGQDEGTEHQGKVDVECGKAERIQDLTLGGRRGGASEHQSPPG